MVTDTTADTVIQADVGNSLVCLAASHTGVAQPTDKRNTAMNTRELATAFTDMLKAGNLEDAVQFNSPDIVSIEAMEGPMAEVRGTDAVKAKSDWWYGAHEVHSVETFGPFINGDRFALRFYMDVTNRESGQRMQMEEIGLYTVKDGKIVEERFFY